MVVQLRAGAAALSKGFECFRAGTGDAEELVTRARQAERKVETLYRKALSDLFAEPELQPLGQGQACIEIVFDRMKRREVYRHLSNAADRLAHAGEALHDLIVKYA
jgi:hypothetical protein